MKKRIAVIVIAAAAACLSAAYMVPVRLDVTLKKSQIYQGEDAENLVESASLTSLLGRKVHADDVTESLNEEDGMLDAACGRFSVSVPVDVIPVEKVTASYDGEVPYGGSIDENAVTVSAEYADGTEKELTSDVYRFGDIPDSITSDTSVDVYTDLGDTTLDIPVISASSIEASYDGSVRYGEDADPDKISVKISFDDGSSFIEDQYTIDDPDSLIGMTKDVHETVHTDLGDAELTVPVIGIKEVKPSYDGKIYYGDQIDADLFSVSVIYDDGSEKDLSSDEYTADLPDGKLTDDAAVHISTDYGETDLTVPVIKVQSFDTSYDGTVNYNDPADPSKISVKAVFEDGKEIELGPDEFQIQDPDRRLTETADILIDTDYGQTFVSVPVQPIDSVFDSIHLMGNVNLPAVKAARENADELKNAVYSSTTDSLYVAITKHETDFYSCCLTHVVVNDPSQVRGELSYGDIGGQREFLADAQKRTGWTVGVNGSYFSYETGWPAYDLVIKNGEVLKGTVSDGKELALLGDGTITHLDAGVSAEDAIAMGVKDTFGTPEPVLIKDGNAIDESGNLISGGKVENATTGVGKRYPRTCIGMVKPGEYYIITAGSDHYNKGMAYDEEQALLQQYGVQFAENIDGGGSAQLQFKDKLVNTPADNGARAVVDFLAFYE